MFMICSFSMSDDKLLRYEQKYNTKSYLLSALWAPQNSSNMIAILLLATSKALLADNHMNPLVTSFTLLCHCHIFSDTLTDQVLST